ncbi:hypothetical protein J057_00809 [Marinobacter nanhaiticus D15-8W]|uniref:Uncharacterized protein n=2 Tax=Marinobacter TaxID=2742 RepID=N6X047_9GAMM|nr:hypothetical protein J057_00809 [Marinobacter nanhaiticus D15-8W]
MISCDLMGAGLIYMVLLLSTLHSYDILYFSIWAMVLARGWTWLYQYRLPPKDCPHKLVYFLVDCIGFEIVLIILFFLSAKWLLNTNLSTAIVVGLLTALFHVAYTFVTDPIIGLADKHEP